MYTSQLWFHWMYGIKMTKKNHSKNINVWIRTFAKNFKSMRIKKQIILLQLNFGLCNMYTKPWLEGCRAWRNSTIKYLKTKIASSFIFCWFVWIFLVSFVYFVLCAAWEIGSRKSCIAGMNSKMGCYFFALNLEYIFFGREITICLCL